MARDMDMIAMRKKSDAEWVQDSNEALHIRLVSEQTPSEDTHEDAKDKDFHPDFTYPFYGEEEKLYGFRQLHIQMAFTAAALKPYLRVKYASKRPSIQTGDTILKPLLEQMFPHVPMDTILSRKDQTWTDRWEVFSEWVERDREWKPMGEKVHAYSLEDQDDGGDGCSSFELYQCSFDTPRFTEFHRRLQLFLLWFIEGASYIDETDPRWEIYVLYQKDQNGRYKTVGYATCYPFYLYPDRLRMRISQFLIMPPYQEQGHGGRLYRFLYDTFLKNPRIYDITVEDPSEGFSDMRTKNDLRCMIQKKALGLTAESPLPSSEQIQAMREEFKFSKQHAVQLAEMLVYRVMRTSRLPEFRVWVKKRIYRKNEEVLATIQDPAEVKRKIAEAYANVEEEYRRIVDMLE